jgi:thiol-disulfide isomerase/thioredoxin
LEVDPKGGNLGTSLTVQVAVVAGSPTGKVNFSALETAGRRMGEPRRIPPEDVEKLVAELRSGYRLKSDVDEVAKNPSAEGLSNLEKKVKAHLDAYPKSLLAPQLQLVTSELKRTVQRSEVVAKLKPGQPVTDLEGLALDGEKFRLSDFRGRVVLLDFWATWCPPCVADVPKMLDLFERHKNNLTIIGINADQDKSTLESFVKERGISWRQVWESEPGGLWQTAFAVEGYPTYVLINRDGSLAAIGLRGRNLIDAIDKLVQSE